ncbi:MAG TPA: peptidoglycan-binding protein [Candidatus Enterousia avicola]|uniref:Peptidoglycan-binding protein n=1 Tax=Candidatus Enterousia avicola TaxID=2840787 RepID=A0A9D1MRW5_9PROT|nr:peptidoglycan-binding protein [Candidatus Enterousia avicola]
MSTNWGDAVWNERGELVVSIYKQPPEMKDNLNNKPKHTYKEIDCGGECGGCVALVVDGEVISGPPFHPNCKCSLSAADIESAPEQESNLGDIVGSNRNSAPEDVKWLKEALQDLGFYEPDTRAGETPEELNQYPNQNLFNAINKFQREHNLSERGIVARKKDFQNRDDYGPIKKYTSWPGGEHGWGKHRVWLEPSKETDTYGRGGFSIHGGEEPGSAGCIDLTSEMPAFADWFKKNGKDLIIKVKY